jgi:chromosome partitioning protein
MDKKSERSTRVILVGNLKGGVGKTTNTLNLASAFVERGKKVLIIDLDVTGGATKALGAPMGGWHSTYDFMTGAAPPLECVITCNDEEVKLPPGIDLIPSSDQLGELEEWLRSPQNKWVVHQDMLQEPIAGLRGHYDLVFLDTPPQVTITTLPGMKVSDYVILSAMPDYASTEQLGDALEDLNLCRSGPNPKLRLLGIIMCAMPKPQTVLARELVKYVRAKCVDERGESYRFETMISRTTAVQEARAIHTTLFQYAGGHKVADEFRELAREAERRMQIYETIDQGAATIPPVPLPRGDMATSEAAVKGDQVVGGEA